MDLRSLGFIGQLVLGRYRIVELIGHGGMGAVFLARHEGAAGFVKPVVIKHTLPQGDTGSAAESAALFAREARIMSNLRHPAIVDVLDFAQELGSSLLVLEYVHGYNLSQWNRFLRLRNRLFSWEIACHVMATVLDALHYGHTLVGPEGELLEVVHRDVSPANVLIDVAGSVKLADFGVARMLTDHTADSKTLALKGKVSYMAPELLQHLNPSPASDVYACGIVLHELLTGVNEMRADTLVQTSTRVLWHVPSAPSHARSDVPPELDAIVARAAAKAPGERFATALEFAQALRSVQTKPADAVAELLNAAAAEDFRDPEMAKALGIHSLAALDQAWRNPPSTAKGTEPHTRRSETTQVAGQPPDSPSSLDIAVEPPANASEPSEDANGPRRSAATEVSVRREEPARRARRFRRIDLAAAIVSVVAVGSVAAIWALQRSSSSAVEDRIIVVQAIPASASAMPLDPGPPVPVAGSAHPALGAPPRARPKDTQLSRAEAMSAVFARQKPQIAQCFGATQPDPAAAEIAVRFEVDTKGKVVSAHVIPPEVAATSLGTCITRVALSTEFGPQPEPLTFRVPITARRLR